jgi:hypothetical protein
MGARLGRHFPSSHAGATMASAARTGSSRGFIEGPERCGKSVGACHHLDTATREHPS